VYSAVCRQSALPLVLKLYRKSRLSELNWYQARAPATSQARAPRAAVRGLTMGGRRRQVEREVVIHCQLFHQNIVALYAAFEDADHVYLAQEYAAGGGCRALPRWLCGRSGSEAMLRGCAQAATCMRRSSTLAGRCRSGAPCAT